MYYYKQVKDGKIISVEAKSADSCSPGFKKATKAEYDSYLASLPPKPSPEPARDAIAELDELKSNLIDKGILTKEEVSGD